MHLAPHGDGRHIFVHHNISQDLDTVSVSPHLFYTSFQAENSNDGHCMRRMVFAGNLHLRLPMSSIQGGF